MAVVAFTARSAQSLKGAPGRRATYYDAVTPGLELRISPQGTRSWSVRCWVAGRQVRVSLGNLTRVGLADARAKAREVLERAGRGEDPRRPRAGKLTVEALCRTVLKAIDVKPSTRLEYERLLAVEIAPNLTMRADRLDREAIRSWVKPIGRRAPIVAHAAFGLLRRCYAWAVRHDLLRETPFVNLEQPPPAVASERVLTTDELRALWVALSALEQFTDAERRPDRAYVDATRLLLLTAVRREMVIGMRRSELEALGTPAARWIVPGARMKGSRDHVVPLSAQAQAIIKRRLAIVSGELLFPAGRSAKGPITWSTRFVADLGDMVNLVAQRELPPWTIHNLRHSAATHMVEDLGVAPDVVSLILAHRPPGSSVSRIYQRAERLGERRKALTEWAAWVEALA